MIKIKIIKKEILKEKKKVYDVTVEDAHHYFLENGVISHNTGGGFMPTKESSGGDGPIFAMSVISFLSKAQLKENGSTTKTGIIVTSNLKKSRFTIPEPVKFHISFANGMNPYVGLQDFVNWEACGIERGKLEEVKNKEGKKELVFTANASSTRWAVKHLGKTVTSSQLFSGDIFTQEVLESLNEKVIKQHFLLPTMGTNEEITNALEAEIGSDFDNLGNAEEQD